MGNSFARDIPKDEFPKHTKHFPGLESITFQGYRNTMEDAVIVSDGTRRTALSDVYQMLDGGSLRVEPFTPYVRCKHPRSTQDAITGMDAALQVDLDADGLAARLVQVFLGRRGAGRLSKRSRYWY